MTLHNVRIFIVVAIVCQHFFIDMCRVPRVPFNPRHRILEPPLMLIIARQKCYDEDRRT